MDWHELAQAESREHLVALDQERAAWLERKPFTGFRAKLTQLPQVKVGRPELRDGVVCLGPDLPANHPDRLAVRDFAREVMPWKKGPFQLLGEAIDAEWRSDYKWDRLSEFLPDLRGKRVLDVGSNNGYYLYRIAEHEPEWALGIDPVARCWYQFQLLQRFAKADNLDMTLWGWEELGCFKDCFDVIFCMGILYHHPDPIRLLRTIREALRPGGWLVLETIVIPGEEPECLFPPDRYARMRNVWFVPTAKSVEHMLARTRYIDIQRITNQPHRPSEQRTTPWNPGPSYRDFLDPRREDRTIEGLPAPWRSIHLARKRG